MTSVFCTPWLACSEEASRHVCGLPHAEEPNSILVRETPSLRAQTPDHRSFEIKEISCFSLTKFVGWGWGKADLFHGNRA